MAKLNEERDAIRRYLNKLGEIRNYEQAARQELLDKRRSDNLELVAELEREVKEHPELRFGQILFNMFSIEGKLDADKLFYQEPSELIDICNENKKGNGRKE